MVKEFSMTDKERVENCKLHEVDLFSDFGLLLYKKLLGKSMSEEDTEERNDVYLYKTLIYPPKSTPPTLN